MLHGVARSDSANGRDETDGGSFSGLDQPAGARALGLKNDTLSFFDLMMETAARVGLRSSAKPSMELSESGARMGRCVSPAAWWIASLLLPGCRVNP